MTFINRQLLKLNGRFLISFTAEVSVKFEFCMNHLASFDGFTVNFGQI